MVQTATTKMQDELRCLLFRDVLQLLDVGMRGDAVNQAGRDQGSEAFCVHIAKAQPASKVTPVRKGIHAVVVVQDGANGILPNGRVWTLWVGSPVAEGMP